MKYTKSLLWLLLFLVMAAIYGFSAQPAPVSDEVSRGIAEEIVDIMPHTKNLPTNQKQEKIRSVNGVVRKYAHFILFFILGVVLFITLLVSFKFKSIWRLWTVCLVVCALYAAFDEVHQLLVDGRGAQVKDVAIDFAGSFTGSGLIIFTYYNKLVRLVAKL